MPSDMTEQIFDNILQRKGSSDSVEVTASTGKAPPAKKVREGDNRGQNNNRGRSGSQNNRNDNTPRQEQHGKNISQTLEDLLKEEKDLFEGILDTELERELRDSYEKAKNEKTYRMMYSGTDIDVDAASLWVAFKRCQDYIVQILKLSTRSTNRRRAFWSDIIMLNIITNKLLKTKTPAQIEELLNPIKYTKIKKTYDVINDDGEQETIGFEL